MTLDVGLGKKQIKSDGREYRKKNKEKIRKYQHDWYLKNKDKKLAKNKNYYKNNKQKIRNKQRLYEKKQYEINPEFRRKKLQRVKEWNKKLRLKVLTHYGGNPPKCTCCGEDYIIFLSVDHINGGGHQHFKKVGYGAKFYFWLKKHNFPKGYQILCFNCNWAKSHGGCPHKNEVKK